MWTLIGAVVVAVALASPDGAQQCTAPQTATELFGMEDRDFVAGSSSVTLTLPAAAVPTGATVDVVLNSPTGDILGFLLNAHVDGNFVGKWLHGDKSHDGSGGAGCSAEEAPAVATHAEVISAATLSLQYVVPASAGEVTIAATVLIDGPNGQAFHALSRKFTVGTPMAPSCVENAPCIAAAGVTGQCQSVNGALTCVAPCTIGAPCDAAGTPGTCQQTVKGNQCVATPVAAGSCTVGQPCTDAAGSQATCLAPNVCAKPCTIGMPCVAPNGKNGECTNHSPLQICVEPCEPGLACIDFRGTEGVCQSLLNFKTCTPTCTPSEDCPLDNGQTGTCVSFSGFNNCVPKCPEGTSCTTDDNQPGVCTKILAGLPVCLPASMCPEGDACKTPFGLDGRCESNVCKAPPVQACTAAGATCTTLFGIPGVCNADLICGIQAPPKCTVGQPCSILGAMGNCLLVANEPACVPEVLCQEGQACTKGSESGTCQVVDNAIQCVVAANAPVAPGCVVGESCTFSNIPGRCVESGGEPTCAFDPPVGCVTDRLNFPCKTTEGKVGLCDANKVCSVSGPTSTACVVGNPCALPDQSAGVCRLEGTPPKPVCLANTPEGCPTPVLGLACLTADGQAGQCNEHRMCIVTMAPSTHCVVGAPCDVDGYKGTCLKASLNATPMCQASEATAISHRCATAQEECFDGALKGDVGICLSTPEGRRCVPNVAAGPSEFDSSASTICTPLLTVTFLMLSMTF